MSRKSALMMMQGEATIRAVRKAESECCQRLLCLFMIALNDTPGLNLGKKRISDVMRRLSELSGELLDLRLEDEDTACAMLERRLNMVFGADEFKIISNEIQECAKIHEAKGAKVKK